MSLIIQKYGGTSVANPKKIKKVAAHIKKCREQGNDVVVVVSAMGKETNRLITLAKGICPNPNERERDHLLQTGEVVTASLLAIALNDMFVSAISLTANQIGLIAVGEYGKAKIKSLQNQALIEKNLEEGSVVVVAGFQGISENGLDIITLGRGGSDTTAVALAAFLRSDVCEIYTDVDGVYTVDPRLVDNAQRFTTISHDQMISMSAAGAGVLMDRAVIVAKRHGVEIKVLLSPSFGKSTGGTLVTTAGGDITDLEKTISSRGIAIKKGLSCIHISDIPNEPGKAHEIFSILGRKINLIEIAQTKPEQTAQISTLVEKDAAEKILPELERILKDRKITSGKGLVALYIIDETMKEASSYFERVTKVLGENGINIEYISTSLNGITVATAEENLKKAACALAEEFNLLAS